MLALLVGAVTVLSGVAKLGFVADLLSKPTQIGYMNGLALTILVGQLPKLFGFSVEGDGLIAEAVGFAKGLGNGETVAAALGVGLLGLAIIGAFQRLVPSSPPCWWRWWSRSWPPTSSTWPITAWTWSARCPRGSRP